MFPRIFHLWVIFCVLCLAETRCQKEKTASAKEVATRFVTTHAALERRWLSAPDLAALLKHMKGGGFQSLDAFEVTKETGDEKQKRMNIRGYGVRRGAGKGPNALRVELVFLGDHWKVADVFFATEGRMVSLKTALSVARTLKRSMIEPFEPIARQTVGGLEVVLGRAKRQGVASYKLVFAYQSKRIFEHLVSAKGLKTLHATRLGLQGKVTTTQHFQRPPKLPFRTDVTLSMKMMTTRPNAEHCLGMDAPPLNHIQTDNLPAFKGWLLKRVGRFEDRQIELKKEPNKRTLRRFQMGEQVIFFNRLRQSSTSQPVVDAKDLQRLLMIQGTLSEKAEWKGISDDALAEAFHLWVDDRAATFAHKQFRRKEGSIHFSIYTYNTFPSTALRRFQLCLFSPHERKMSRRLYVFKDVFMR